MREQEQGKAEREDRHDAGGDRMQPESDKVCNSHNQTENRRFRVAFYHILHFKIARAALPCGSSVEHQTGLALTGMQGQAGDENPPYGQGASGMSAGGAAGSAVADDPDIANVDGIAATADASSLAETVPRAGSRDVMPCAATM